MLCAIRPWIQKLLSFPSNALWELKRVLPGQRNGAQRWFNAFSDRLRQLGFVQCQAMPSVLRHKHKKIVVNVHVDDELIASETTEDALWLTRELKKVYKLQIEGPYPIQKLGNGEEVNCLKKTHLFKEDGLCQAEFQICGEFVGLVGFAWKERKASSRSQSFVSG